MRVAFFPCVYHEIDGVAQTSRHFEMFAKRRGLPFFLVHAGMGNEITIAGSSTRVQLGRGPATFPLDRSHNYDLLFLRHYRRLARLVKDFRPDVVQITGPSDVGALGALIAHRLNIPLAASWQTNVHQFARSRASSVMSFLPSALSSPLLEAVERWTFRAAARFYKIPQFLFAPNQEIVQVLEKNTGKPCSLMAHGVDTKVFNPEFRDREKGPFRIGYVGRLTAEKNVRLLARLEQSLLAMGHKDFRIVVVGDGAEGRWLREHTRQAEFTGVVTGRDLSRAFANMDVLVFPSETDTFGLVVLEAFASGVPAVVTAVGGPKFTVRHGSTGYVANDFDEFVAFTAALLTQPDLLSSMRTAAREYALTATWERVYENMYEVYERCLSPARTVSNSVFDEATI